VTSIYAATAQRALATIRKKGAPFTLTTASGRVYDPDLGTWTGGAPVVATGYAVQDEDDPMRFSALSLTLVDPVTLLAAAFGLAVVPAPNMALTWAGVIYTVKNVEAIAPDGTAIVYTLIGSRE
jgi:hypothetical protein